MIKPAALLMGVVMAAVSSGTYFALDLLVGSANAHEAPAPAPVVVAAAPAPAAAPAVPAEPAPVADAPDAAPETAAAAPAPAPEPAPKPAAEAAPAPEPATPAAPALSPAAAEPREPAAVATTASPAPVAKAAPEADVLKQWWPDPSTMPANQLKLQYAGQVQGHPAIALLFTAPLKVETLAGNVSVLSANGQTVAGDWTVGKNPKMAMFSGLSPGRYTVILQPQVADQQGFMLGATLKGPVYIKEF